MTKKIKESTVAGSVAVVPAPLGNMQKRAGSMFKGKKTKKKFYESPQFTSKQQVIDYFVRKGKTAKQGAAAWERGYRGTKKATPPSHWLDRAEKAQQDREDQNPVNEQELQEQDVIIVPGQGQRLKPGLIMKDKDRTDHEVEMALSDLYQSAKNAKMLYDMIKDIPEEQGLEGWVQEKIIKASDYLNTVREYMEHKSTMHEASLKQMLKTTARKLDPTMRGRLAAQSYDRNQYARTMRNMAGGDLSPEGEGITSREERHADRLRRLANKENPFTGQPKVDEMTGGVLAGGMSNFEEGVAEGSLNEAQKFDFTSNKQTIMTFIDNVLKNKSNNKQFNPFYALIVGDPKIGGASKLGLTPEFAAIWKKYFQNPAFIGGAPEPWSQYDVGDKFPKATGDDRTLNFYITVDKEKNNVAKFINNINKLPSYLKPISDQYKTPIKFKTHSLLDSFIGHNDSLKVYYYDPKAKDAVVNATKQWLSDSSIATGSRSHEHGVDVKSGGGSFGQILSNHVYDSFTELIKNNGNKFTSEQYFTWLEQHLPALIKQVQQKQTQGVAEEQAPMFTPEEKQLDEKKDACYSKVKRRHKVWPSAYASGALVQCRKVGPSNWGNKSEK